MSRKGPSVREKPLSVAFPGSVVSVDETVELKTIKVSVLARALAMFRVSEAVIYRDADTSERDMKLVEILMRYFLTPPHLRRLVFPVRKELRAVGLAQPLRLTAHEAPSVPKKGIVVEGYVESCEGDVCTINLGRLGRGRLAARVKEGSIVTVRIESVGDFMELSLATRGGEYTGFSLRMAGDIREVIEEYRKRGYLIVASSRHGRPARGLAMKAGGNGVLVIFGGPRQCPYEFLPKDLFDLAINSVPEQGIVTIRTEEAIIATLSALECAGLLG